ncbi:MAG: hypothetical protein SXV54_13660 [Chloroflexota bacterium]|nr:hypothetical protein [Chloroflexota bacterium]
MSQPISAFRRRVRQFFRALSARVTDEELGQVAYILTPASLALFRSMSIQDQRHGLDVCATLQQTDYTHPDLLAAALLHDVGKAAARIPAWQRAVIVLLHRFAPRLLARLSQGDLPKGWRRFFVVYARHPEVGAHWAQEAGCSPLTVSLIRRHQDKLASNPSLTGEEDLLLAALQAADSAN